MPVSAESCFQQKLAALSTPEHSLPYERRHVVCGVRRHLPGRLRRPSSFPPALIETKCSREFQFCVGWDDPTLWAIPRAFLREIIRIFGAQPELQVPQVGRAAHMGGGRFGIAMQNRPTEFRIPFLHSRKPACTVLQRSEGIRHEICCQPRFLAFDPVCRIGERQTSRRVSQLRLEPIYYVDDELLLHILRVAREPGRHPIRILPTTCLCAGRHSFTREIHSGGASRTQALESEVALQVAGMSDWSTRPDGTVQILHFSATQ